MVALLAVPFLDELASGVAPASAPDIARSLGVPGGIVAGATIVCFHSLAFFVEPPLLAWSERVPARWFSAAALAALAVSAFGAAIFPSAWSLALALAVYGPASGCALAVAEGVLVEAEPLARERTMTHVSLAGNTGDLAVPLLLASLSHWGLGWRAGFLVAAALASLLALAHASERSIRRPPCEASGEADGPPPTLTAALGTALSTPPLLGWSLASAATGLLDEVLVAFSAVHLQAIGATIDERSLAIAAWIVGGFAGLAALERIISRASVRRVLLGASVVTAFALVVLAHARSPFVATLALLLIGTTGSVLHPLTKAQAYRALPNRPALVNAVGAALLPLDMAAPIALGILATLAGSAWAIVGLLLAPAGVVIAACRMASHARGDSAM